MENDAGFYFDWRLDPVENARQLDIFIDSILQNYGPYIGFDKVNIACVSGSGPVGLAYLSEYGHDKLNAVTFTEAFLQGSSLWGGIATGGFELCADSLGNTGPMYDWGLQSIIEPLIPMIRALYETGMIDVISKVFNRLAADAYSRMYRRP